MKDFFRQSMAWLHTWVGLLLGWLLYFMFITGTAGYLDTEIDRWMTPELPPASELAHAQPRVLQAALGYLEANVPDAERWFINLAPGRDHPYPRVFWNGAQAEGVGTSGSQLLNPETGAVLEGRDTAGGQTLYRMHWKLHYLPEAVSDWIVGVATMFMLLALITGIIVHKKIFKDFFTFRPRKGQRSWLDAHNVVSVLSLPFQLMITYSGLIFMMFIYMPLVVASWYGTDADSREAFFADVFEPPALVEASGRPAALAPFAEVLAAARQQWDDAEIEALDIRHPGDASARIIVRASSTEGPLRSGASLVFDGTSGELLAEQPAIQHSAKAFRDIMLGLHEGRFAGPAVRALYVISGLLGAAMMATGLILWTAKRRQRMGRKPVRAHAGLRTVEKLNVATVAGLPVSIAAYFWANRLLPTGMEMRAEWEVNALFLCWLAALVHAALRPARRAWIEQCWAAALLFGLLPLLSAIITERHLLLSLGRGDWVFVGFELGVLALGIGFALLARYLTLTFQKKTMERPRAARMARAAS